MPLAFPSDALFQDYHNNDSASNGYYTNEDSEADTPLSPNLNAPRDIIIDPALLGESNPHPVSAS